MTKPSVKDQTFGAREDRNGATSREEARREEFK